MNVLIQKITLDFVNPSPWIEVYTKQRDDRIRHLSIVLLNDGISYTIPSGVTARVRGRKPDGTQFYNDCLITAGKIDVALTESMLAVSGFVEAEIELSDSTGVLSTAAFTIRVWESSMNFSATERSNEYQSIDKIKIDTLDYKNQAEAAKIAAQIASTNAQTAKTAAETANGTTQTAKITTEGYKNTAIQKAAEAATSATAAEMSKTTAVTIAANLQNVVNAAATATTAANIAKDTANTAAATANTATTAATTAKNNADAASGKANTATSLANAAAEACKGIVDGLNTMVDPVLSKSFKMGISGGNIYLEEV